MLASCLAQGPNVSAQASKVPFGAPPCFVHHRRYAQFLAAVNVAGTGSYTNVFCCGECLATWQAENRTKLWLVIPSPASKG